MANNHCREAEAHLTCVDAERLSDCLLWSLQRRFFESQGIRAWRDEIVPDYITTNPVVADCVATQIVAFLRDWRDKPGNRLDPQAPIYVVELGAGAGRFGFRCAQRLHTLLSEQLRGMRSVYVMTEVANSTITYWREHRRLRPLLQEGLLDFAYFDATTPGELQLIEHALALDAAALVNPLVVVANYVFDSLPNDGFAVENSQLYENLVHVTAPSSPESDAAETSGRRNGLDDLDLTWERTKASPQPYRSALHNDILEERRALGDGAFLYPIAAMECIDHFRTLSHDRVAFLVADKGYHTASELLGRPDTKIAHHGSVSVMVNFHALAEYTRRLGGCVLQPGEPADNLVVADYVFGLGHGECTNLRQAYSEGVEDWGPDAFFTFKRMLRQHYASMNVEQLLDVLRVSHADERIFRSCLPHLLAQLEQTTAVERELIRDMVWQVWKTHLPIATDDDIAFSVGVVLFRLGWPAEALELFEESMRVCGPDASATYNIAMCYAALGRTRVARGWLEKTRALDPEFEPLQLLDAR